MKTWHIQVQGPTRAGAESLWRADWRATLPAGFSSCRRWLSAHRCRHPQRGVHGVRRRCRRGPLTRCWRACAADRPVAASMCCAAPGSSTRREAHCRTGTIGGMTHPHRARTGVQTHRSAPAGYSVAGLSAAWRHESAFRQECALAARVAAGAPWWVGRSWIEVALLAGSVMGVLIVELLNSAIEAADRSGVVGAASVVQARQGHRQRRR